MGKISDLIDEFNRTGQFCELLERLDVLICIRNEYMKEDWRIVDVCGYTTHYVGTFLMSPIGSGLKSVHIVNDYHGFIFKDIDKEWYIKFPSVVVNADNPDVVMHEYIRRERAVDLAGMRDKMKDEIAELQYAVDCINLEIGYKL